MHAIVMVHKMQRMCVSSQTLPANKCHAPVKEGSAHNEGHAPIEEGVEPEPTNSKEPTGDQEDPM